MVPVMNGSQLPTSQAAPEARPEDSWTVGRLLTWTTDFLRRHGSESPRLDAEVMLAHVLQWQRVQLYTHFEVDVTQSSRSAFRDLVRRRSEGAPVAYLVGRKEFYSLAFAVSPAVLIPRPESEFVVVEYLEQTRHITAPYTVDVGTGSGCLAIASAHHQRAARFVAIDVSEDALALARRNATAIGVADRIDFRLGDQLDPIAGEGPFDAIMSNPPYIPTEAIQHLEPGVRDFEPRTALDGGPGGLGMVARLIEKSVDLLKPGGHLILEIGSNQEEPVRSLIAAQPSLKLAPTVFDHAQHPRVIRATRIA
jgi:release factor glutamine methyltransferase